MPTLLGDVRFTMAFKILVCTRKQDKVWEDSYRAVASLGEILKLRIFFVLLKSCDYMTKLPQLHHALPYSFYDAATLLWLSFLFSLRTPLLSHM